MKEISKLYPTGTLHYENGVSGEIRTEPLVCRVTKIEFNSSLPPTDPVNYDAARSHGLRWNPDSNFYEDGEGCKVRDRFGQPV